MERKMMEIFSLKGKRALVTGASRGIGLEIAQGFCEAGAEVLGIARSEKPQRSVDFQYVSKNINEDFESWVKGKTFDVLVNAAGITEPASEGEEIKLARSTLETNLLTPYEVCLAVSKGMIEKKSGSIINVTSIASEVGLPGNPSYHMSKGGLRMMTKALARDLGPHGVRANNLAPGYFHTDMTHKSFMDSDRNERIAKHSMLGRWGDPKELVGAAVFLASDASSYVTGIDLFVDGGWISNGMV